MQYPTLHLHCTALRIVCQGLSKGPPLTPPLTYKLPPALLTLAVSLSSLSLCPMQRGVVGDAPGARGRLLARPRGLARGENRHHPAGPFLPRPPVIAVPFVSPWPSPSPALPCPALPCLPTTVFACVCFYPQSHAARQREVKRRSRLDDVARQVPPPPRSLSDPSPLPLSLTSLSLLDEK